MSENGPMLRHCCLKEDYDLYIRSVLKRAIIDSRLRHISLKEDNKFDNLLDSKSYGVLLRSAVVTDS